MNVSAPRKRAFPSDIAFFQFGLAALAASSASAGETPVREELYLIADSITVVGDRHDYGAASLSSATKTDTPLIEVPQSISVISKELIDDQAMRSLADVTRYAPGVTMGQGEGHRDAPTLRGNSTTADFYIDGVRDDVQYYRALYNVERVEILKGPNAMIFGRGGGGGVINRVIEKASQEPVQEILLQGGSFGSGRAALDIGGGVSDKIALRLNGVYENSDSYRDFVGLERYGVNPTLLFDISDRTSLRVSYEHFRDERTVDRGVPSLNGRPYDGDRGAFFGNPDLSFAEAEVDFASITIEHDFSDSFKLRNSTHFAEYDKFYQNVHAGSAVDANGDVALQAYRSSTDRRNVFNQTDFILETSVAGVAHRILVGAEIGNQDTDNTRSDNNNSAGVVNISDPTSFAPVLFPGLRSNDNVKLSLAAVYFQDQIDLTDEIQLIGGVRFDRFDLEYESAIVGQSDFSRTDNVVSPRGGVIYKPVENASLYASYSISFLPQSGDQFPSLSATTAALKPERFENIEVGAKWDVHSNLSLTAAVYRLDRDNTLAIDPQTNLTVLTGSQRSKGVEVGVLGSVTDDWEIAGGYAYQDVKITSDTLSAPAGRIVPLTPKHSFSLWNAYHFAPNWRAGLGVIHQAESFASISNAVVLPAFTRVDAALFFNVTENVEIQLNVENLLDKEYWGTAHNDNNITPGGPRAFRVTLTGRL